MFTLHMVSVSILFHSHLYASACVRLGRTSSVNNFFKLISKKRNIEMKWNSNNNIKKADFLLLLLSQLD